MRTEAPRDFIGLTLQENLLLHGTAVVGTGQCVGSMQCRSTVLHCMAGTVQCVPADPPHCTALLRQEQCCVCLQFRPTALRTLINKDWAAVKLMQSRRLQTIIRRCARCCSKKCDRVNWVNETLQGQTNPLMHRIFLINGELLTELHAFLYNIITLIEHIQRAEIAASSPTI